MKTFLLTENGEKLPIEEGHSVLFIVYKADKIYITNHRQIPCEIFQSMVEQLEKKRLEAWEEYENRR